MNALLLPAREGEDFAVVAVDAHHSAFVWFGACTDAPDDKMPRGSLLLVQDKDGWATLHRVLLTHVSGGKRYVDFGPRVAWPDGSIAARHTGHVPEGASGPPSAPPEDAGGGSSPKSLVCESGSAA